MSRPTETVHPIQHIVDLPLTGIRFVLADKLLRANRPDRFAPISPGQIEQLAAHMDEAHVNINQQFNFKIKAGEVQEAMLNGKAIGEPLWELILALKIIQATEGTAPGLIAHIEQTVRDWRGCSFSPSELKLVLQQVQEQSSDRRLDSEIQNAYQAIFTGKAPQDIDLATPGRQLIWAAHLLFLIYNPWLMHSWSEDKRQGSFALVRTKLWKQLLDSHHARYMRVLFGSHIYNLLRNDKVLVGWGAPGSWFSFSVHPAPGRINCDLLYAMLVGFDHARACIVHEIGHAVQTKGVPHYIQELSDAVGEIESDVEGESLQQELQLKQYFLNACEDNCINRYTTDIGGVFGQDYGYSLNYFYTAIGDVGRRYQNRQPYYDESTPQNRFKNLTFIISRAFLTHNDLFADTAQDWDLVMARPEWIKGRDRRNPEEFLDEAASFAQLMAMCEEVEYYFPPLQDMAGGPEHYAELATTYAEKRFALIQEMWRLYAQDILEEMIENDGSRAEDAMDQFQMKMNHQEDPPKKKEKKEEEQKDDAEDDPPKEENLAPPTQSDSDSDQDSNEDLDGDPPDQTPPPEDQDDDSGDSGEDSSSGGDAEDDDPQDSEDAGDEGEPEVGDDEEESGGDPEEGGSGAPDNQEKPPPEKPEPDQEIPEDAEREEEEMEGEPPEGAETKEERDPDAPEDPDRADEVPQEEEEPPTQLSPEELEALMQQLMDQLNDVVEYKEDEDSEIRAEEDEEAEAELVREEEDPDLEPEQKPMEEMQEDKSGERGDEPGGLPDSKGVLDRAHLPDDPMASISDLMEALRETEQLEQNKPERRPPERNAEEPPPKPKIEIPPPMSLDQLATGNWEDFNRRVALHGPVIALMAKALEKLKIAQLKLIHKISKRHSIIPEGGDLRRFDHAAMQRLMQQIAKNERFHKDDLAMFRKDDRRAAPTRPTRVILIDGSRSMTFGAHPFPMDKAIQEAVIDYMASRIAGYDTYIGMFGPLNPISLAQPGDSLVEIGKRIEKVHGGLNTMTYLAPSLMQTVELLAHRKKFTEPYVGFTNFVIYTDGDIDDLRNSREIIQQIILHSPKSTFDFVMITGKHATPMDILIRTLEIQNPIHEVGVVRSSAKRQYPLALTATYKLTTRIRAAKSGFADPAWMRGAQFKRLLHLLSR
ncbi:MAG: hypothetical protein AAF998_11945 [Bacteroidota bacterium]